MAEEQSKPFRLAVSAAAVRHEKITISVISGLLAVTLTVFGWWPVVQRSAPAPTVRDILVLWMLPLAIAVMATWSLMRRLRESAVLVYPDCIIMCLSGRTDMLDVAAGAEIALRQDQQGRHWVIAADGSLRREIRIPVAAFPTLPEFLSRHYRVTPREIEIGP